MNILMLAVMLGFGALVGPADAQAQVSPPPKRPIREVLTSAKLPSVVDAPLHFKLLSVKVTAGQTTNYAGANGMLYVVSGSLAVATDGESKNVRKGEGVFLPGGKRAMLKATGKDPAAFLHYLLLPTTELNKAAESEPAIVTELYRTTDPIPGLQAGPYEFTLTRVTVLPGTPPPPMHHRSGAALYYVFGNGAIGLQDKTEPRPQGAVQYEPYTLVHSWANIGTTPLILIQANISQEGVPEIIFIR